MAFGRLSTFHFPAAANAGTSLWGTDVRRVLPAAETAGDTSTVLNYGTGGSAVRTADPYSTSTADLDQAAYGWAIAPADMGSTSTAPRAMNAGTHTLATVLTQTVLDNASITLTMYVYRVASAAAGRARTLVASGSASTQLAVSGLTAAISVPVTVPEVVFGPDETIMWAVEATCTGAALTGRSVTLPIGTASSAATRVTTPPLLTLVEGTGAASGLGTATATTGRVLGSSGAADGLGTAVGALSAQAAGAGTAAGLGTVAGQVSSLSATAGTATGEGVAAAAGGSLIGTTGTVVIGAAGTGPGETVIRPLFVFDD